MKRFFATLALFSCFSIARADHITGGEMFYTFSGLQNGQYQYAVVLKMYMRCNSGRRFNNPTTVSIFNRATNGFVTQVSVTLTNTETISLTNPGPCVTNPPTVCYEVGYYEFTVALPSSVDGYVMVASVNYRING